MNRPNSLRICQMSDMHYSGRNLEESERCFSHAVDQAIAGGADCVVISGDSTDHALDVHSPAFVALARNIRRLADHCPVLMLQGTFSHEPPGTLSVFRLLGGHYPVFVADRIQQVVLLEDGRWSGSDGWQFDAVPEGARMLFSCIPTVNKASVAAVVGATAAAEAMGEEMAKLLLALAPIHRRARTAGVAAAVVSHGTVSGCTTEHGVPMASLDHEFTTGTLFGAEAPAVMLGHIHAHQVWERDGQVIAYAGSIGRFHYGEEGDKGMLVWQVSAHRASAVLEPTPARRTLEVRFAGAPDLDELRAIASEAQGAYVKVSWEIGEEERATVDRDAIQAALAGAAEIKLEGRIIPVVRTRAEGISAVISLDAKLEKWADVVGTDPMPLQGALAELAFKTPEEIAAEILGTSAHPVRGGEASSPAPAAETTIGVPDTADLFA